MDNNWCNRDLVFFLFDFNRSGNDYPSGFLVFLGLLFCPCYAFVFVVDVGKGVHQNR